jgi:DNA-binding NarL/FixJ family response regulator
MLSKSSGGATEPLVAPSPHPPPRTFAHPAPLTILVVDDNRHMRRLLLEILGMAFRGSSILEAADGREAMAQCLQAMPNIVVMDIGLPDADGIELTATIRLLCPQTEVVVLSSHEGSAYRDAARCAGAATYVAKIDVSTELIPAISAALRPCARRAEPGDRTARTTAP